MKIINLQGYFSNDSAIAIAQNLPNLTHLEIISWMFISKASLLTIFEHLIWLRSLVISTSQSENSGDMFEPHEAEQTLTTSIGTFSISRLRGLLNLSLSEFDDLPGAGFDDIVTLRELTSIDFNCLPSVRLLKYKNFGLIH